MSEIKGLSQYSLSASKAEQRLESWKEIAVYLRRDVRTVQRWEKQEQLPVHRHIHSKLGTVYAYRSELDAWWRNEHGRLEVLAENRTKEAVEPVSARVNAASRVPINFRNAWYIAGLAILLAVLAAKFFWPGFHQETIPRASTQVTAFTTLPGAAFAPSFSPDGKQVVFAWTGAEGNELDLYTRAIGAEAIHRITSRGGRAMLPAWSPNGRQIAFLRFNEAESGIFLVPADGGSERKLMALPWNPDYLLQSLNWSPNGEFLAYAERFHGGDTHRIVLLSMRDSGRHILTTPPAGWSDTFPVFSPDGQRIAFYRCIHADCLIQTVPVRGGETVVVSRDFKIVDGELAWTHNAKAIIAPIRRGNGHELWRFPLEGGDREILYSSPTDHVLQMAVAPDGKSLIFAAMHIGENIWRYQLGGSRHSTHPPARFISSSRGEEFPQFAPDGKQIAFQSIRSGAWEVWVCDNNGNNPRQLSHTDDGNSLYPRWSPDSLEIAYDTRRAGHSSIFVVKASGGALERLDTEDLDAEVPSFSPDGQWIYFAGRRDKSWQVWKIPRVGGAALQVTQDGGYMPVISADNRWVYYSKGPASPGIWRVAVGGGNEELVLPELEGRFYADWALTRDGIYFLSSPAKPVPGIQFFDFKTRTVTPIVPLEKAETWSDGLAVSPDGEWLLYPRPEKLQSNLMLLEGLR